MTDHDQPGSQSEAQRSDMPDDMELLYLGLLRRGSTWTPEVTPEVEALQEAHLANIERMRQSGELLVAGPFGDDGDLRGVYIFRVASMEEAIALTDTDPAVQAGRLVFELHPWWVKKEVFGGDT
jgi:uncharacterized protein YciI